MDGLYIYRYYPSGVVGMFICSVAVSVRKSPFSLEKRIKFEVIRYNIVDISQFLCVSVCVRLCVCVCVRASHLSYMWSYVRYDFVLPACSILRIPQHSVGWN